MAMEQQSEFMRRFFTPRFDAGFGGLGAMSRSMATFKTRVQSGGRISIPDTEREALDIQEGDIVQTVVVPVKRGGDDGRGDGRGRTGSGERGGGADE